MRFANFFIDSYRLLIFVGVQFLIAVSNWFLLRRPKKVNWAGRRPKVSVLVPARNEEKTIALCVNSLIAQDYPDFEVVVLNDRSEDRTREILADRCFQGLRVIEGKEVLEGWTGKNWACYQLAQNAAGEILLFTDADTVFQRETLSSAVGMMQESGADMLTGIVRNVLPSFGEQITVPFLFWSIMSILPVGVAQSGRSSKAFVAANGKFLLFRKTAYELIGGHQAVKAEAAEDLALGRLIKGARMRWLLIDCTGLVSTRMYHGLLSAWQGFSKNFFAIFDYRVVPALFVWFWMLLITYHPLIVAGVLGLKGDFSCQFQAAAGTVILTVLIWVLTVLKGRLPKRIVLFYPLTMTVAVVIGLSSLVLTVFGRTGWKGRRLPRHRIRIF